mgnify:CR=1 FL=1
MAFIEKIKIQNFKSHNLFQSVIPKKNIVVSGHNGIGKTNLLESLSFFSNSKGMRANKLDHFLKKNNNIQSRFSQVDCSLKQANYSTKITYKIFKDGNQIQKDFFIDDKKTSNNQISNLINFIWLSPHMDKIMYEEGNIKKNFIDKIISNLSINFKKNLSDFKKLSDERIALLTTSTDENWISIIEKKMAKFFYLILIERRSKISSLNQISTKKLKLFSEFKINITNDLEGSLNKEDRCIEEVQKIFYNNRDLDASIKRNTFGPSIDRITFFHCKKNLNSELCSTGEQKSILLSIVLAFAWIYKQEGIQFILLFDEISSHIDEQNMENFFVEVAKFDTQAWYTGTNKKIFQVIENKAFFIDLA